jgi:hypothetical protein
MIQLQSERKEWGCIGQHRLSFAAVTNSSRLQCPKTTKLYSLPWSPGTGLVALGMEPRACTCEASALPLRYSPAEVPGQPKPCCLDGQRTWGITHISSKILVTSAPPPLVTAGHRVMHFLKAWETVTLPVSKMQDRLLVTGVWP